MNCLTARAAMTSRLGDLFLTYDFGAMLKEAHIEVSYGRQFAVTESQSGGGVPPSAAGWTPLVDRFAEARVYIIDDNPSNVALLVAILQRAGFRKLFTEVDSRRVLESLSVVDPDLIILDLHMPHLDGFAALKQIRNFAPSEALPVLVLTADTSPGGSERAMNAGAQDFVTKPFANGEIVVRTKSLLRSRFLYTTLRSSILRQHQAAHTEQIMAEALTAEQQAVERLQLLDGLKDTLLQTVSHDLRNPVWAVLLMTDALAADADGTAPLSASMRSAIIEKVSVSARHMDQLIKDVLDSDPMRSLEDHPDRCNVGEVVSRVLAEVDLAQDHPLKVDISPVMADVDPIHLERIVANLLNNARQHLAAGVPIWVSVVPAPNGVLISVDDAGDGVDPEIAANIFEPFRRGQGSSGQGLGLGLSLVSRFAELHGGRAWTEDRPGGGARFRVFLPAAPDREKPLEPAIIGSR